MRQLLPPSADGSPVDLRQVYTLPDRRHVRVNFVSSLDGAAEVDGKSGPLGGPADKQVFTTLRALTDVVLVGAGTARAENYGPAKVAGRAPEDQPPLALVSRSLRLEPGARFFAEPGPRPIVVTCAAADAPNWLADKAVILRAGDADVDLTGALDQLADRGLRRVLCEGGPSLFGTLVEHDLVDELCLTYAPVLAGPDRRHILSGDRWSGPRALSLESLLEDDGVLLARYAVRR